MIQPSQYILIAWSTQKSTLIICMDRKGFGVHLFNPPFPPRLFWTTHLSLPDIALYCKKHIISKHAPFVYAWGFLCAHMCVCVCFSSQPRHATETEGGEFDICKLNSAQTWQWWSVVHSSRDCLYLHSCPWVLQQVCPLRRPRAQATASSSINDSIEKSNSY